MWYYTTNGQQHGPIDEAAFDALIANGTVVNETYVWQNGMPDWLPLAQVRRTGSQALSQEEVVASTCAICGKRVGSQNLIELMGNRVCADCKPLALQTLREGASLPVKNNTAWREGKRVVAYHDTSLPARCYKCNCDVTKPPMQRKLTWHPPGYYILVVISILVYVIVALVVRKRATIGIYLCEEHTQRRSNFIIGGWIGALLGLVATVYAISTDTGWAICLAVVLFLGSIITGVAGAQLASASRIKDNKVWLARPGKAFLASLPPLP